MRCLNSRNRRSGGVMVETALVLPLLVVILVAMIVGGLGVFRYQQVVTLAREGARYASVHGAQYQADNPGQTAATPADVYNNAILPMAAGLDSAELHYSVTWPQNTNWPVYADPNSNPPGQPIGTTVAVTVSYDWIPELNIDFGVLGTMNFSSVSLSSTSVMPMHY